MHTHLVRKQVLLDKESINELEAIIGSDASFSQYLRDLIDKDLESIKQKSSTQVRLLKSKSGFIKKGGFRKQRPENLSWEIDKLLYED
jgi:hypothetical protein